MFRDLKVIGLGFAALSFGFIATCLPQAEAQEQVRRRPGPAPQNFMYYTQPINSPASLPSLPEYNGKQPKFEGGHSYPKLRSGVCYVMHYLAKETPASVINSYRDSLQQMGWTINEVQSSKTRLNAVKKREGLYFTVFTFPTQKSGYKSSFEIKYLSMGKPVTR